MAFPTGWGRKCKITIPDAQIQGSHTDFPVLLTVANFPAEMLDGAANSALNGGGDVRFSEDSAGATRLACDIVSFVTGGTASAEIHVKLPTLNTGAAKEIWVWYNKAGEVQPAITDPFGRNAVWAGEEITYHMGQDPSGNAPQIIDSTGNGHDATSFGAMTSTDVVPGQIGNGLAFDGLNDYLDAGINAANLGIVRHATFSARYKLNNIPVAGTDWFAFISDWASLNGMSLRIEGDNKLVTYVYPNNHRATAIVNHVIGVWHRATAVMDGLTLRLYHDGVQVATATLNENIGSSPSTIKISERGDLNGDFMDGVLDEIKIASVARSADWIATENANESSPATFASAGIPQTAGSGASIVLQEAFHGLVSDNVVLGHFQNLALSDAAHGQTPDSPVLTQGQSLTLQGSLHGLISDTAALASGNSILSANCRHNLLSDQSILQQIQSLTLLNSIHGLVSDNAGLSLPGSYSPGPARISSPQGSDRTLRPTNSRTYRI